MTCGLASDWTRHFPVTPHVMSASPVSWPQIRFLPSYLPLWQHDPNIMEKGWRCLGSTRIQLHACHQVYFMLHFNHLHFVFPLLVFLVWSLHTPYSLVSALIINEKETDLIHNNANNITVTTLKHPKLLL